MTSTLDCHECMMDLLASSCFRFELRYFHAFRSAHRQLVVCVHRKSPQSTRNSPCFRGFLLFYRLRPHSAAYDMSLYRTILLFLSVFPPDFPIYDYIDQSLPCADIHHRGLTYNNKYVDLSMNLSPKRFIFAEQHLLDLRYPVILPIVAFFHLSLRYHAMNSSFS